MTAIDKPLGWASSQGELWRARDYAEREEGVDRADYLEGLRRIRISPGTALLDVGCDERCRSLRGSSERALLAAHSETAGDRAVMPVRDRMQGQVGQRVNSPRSACICDGRWQLEAFEQRGLCG